MVFSIKQNLLILSLFFCAAKASSVMLDEVQFEDGDTCGIMLSTFDPLTLFHEDIIDQALASGKIKYLVVIPTDFTPHKPRRTLASRRHEMLIRTYEKHPNVIVTRPYQFMFPHSRGVTRYLKRKAGARVKTVGVVLFEDLVGSSVKQLVARFLTPTDRWLVLRSEAASEQDFPDTLGGKPVEFAIAEHPSSSKIARTFLRGNSEFFAGSVVPDISELPVNDSVREYIRSQMMYLKKPPVCALFADIVYSWWPLW